MKTKSEMIHELETSREVQLVSKQWVPATGFDWKAWKKAEVEELLATSRARQ